MSIEMIDALEMDEEQILAKVGAQSSPWESSEPASIHIVGNLPFAVSTELLLKWIRQIPSRSGAFKFGRVPLTLLFQKEVANRIVAFPGSRDHAYGRLSVMTQHCANVSRKFDVSRKAFVPSPDVDASVVSLVPSVTPRINVDLVSLEFVLRQMFGQRRKTLRNSVSTLEFGSGGHWGSFFFLLFSIFNVMNQEILDESKIASTKRTDELTIEEWGHLATTLDVVWGRHGKTCKSVGHVIEVNKPHKYAV